VQASPAEAVLEAGKEADLVVVGGPPAEGARRLFVGSVARQVINHTTRPVVVVRGPAG
jgi:nucleotide-binding universal stress UspA family protein